MNHTPIANGKIKGIVVFLIVGGRARMQLLFAQQAPKTLYYPPMGRKITQ